MLYGQIGGHTKLIRLYCFSLGVSTWTILALFSGSASSGKSESTSGTLSASSIGCSSSDTWQRAEEKPQACQRQHIDGGKQGQIPQSPAAHLQWLDMDVGIISVLDFVLNSRVSRGDWISHCSSWSILKSTWSSVGTAYITLFQAKILHIN